MEERRKSPRLLARKISSFHTDDSVVEQIGYIEDYNDLGLSFLTEVPLKLHTMVSIKLDEDSVLEGEVLHSKKVGEQIRYGIRLVRLSEAQIAQIKTYLTTEWNAN